MDKSIERLIEIVGSIGTIKGYVIHLEISEIVFDGNDQLKRLNRFFEIIVDADLKVFKEIPDE